MKSIRAVARVGLIAVGLGIGGVFVSIAGTASADSSNSLATVDSLLSGVAVPGAADTPALNLAISYDGMTLFQSGSALADSGANGDIAIANGAGATAYAYGTDNYAFVDGTDSHAYAGAQFPDIAGSSADNTAFVFGDDDTGLAGTTDAANPGNFNFAIIFGNGDGAYAGGDSAGAGSYSGAYAEGNDLPAAYAQGGNYMLDIAKFYGDGPGSSPGAAVDALGSDPSGALADSQTFWADLLSGNTAGAWTAGQDFWADVASSLNVTSAATDLSNFWTELATLF